MSLFLMALLLALVDCMGACVSSSTFTEAPRASAKLKQPDQEPKREFHQEIETTIPIVRPTGESILNADGFRPTKKITPVTLVVIAPGSGNVSRRGEMSGD